MMLKYAFASNQSHWLLFTSNANLLYIIFTNRRPIL